MRIPALVVPKEHGAWAILLVPLLTAISVTQACSLNIIFLTLSALSLFMSYVPVHAMLREMVERPQGENKLYQARFWAAVYLSLSVLFVTPLVLQGYNRLLMIGMIGGISFFGNFFLTRQYSKTIPSDLIAVFGLTLSAPGGYYVLTGLLDRTAIMLWILNFLFFGCCVFYVHMKIRASALNKLQFSMGEKISIARYTLIYHLAVISIVLLFVLDHDTRQLGILAFVPMTAHAVYGTLKLSSKVRFKNLGLLLLGQSLLFGILLGVVE